MNFLICDPNHVSNHYHIFVLYSVITLIIFNVTCIMCQNKFEERSLPNTNTSRAHRCKYMGNFALQVVNCDHWSCWESQLRDQSRIEFLNIYNRFRTSVIQQQCKECQFYKDYPVMVQLEWHWKLEQESQKAIQNCPYQDFKSNIKIGIHGNNLNGTTPMQCEMVATSFPIQSGSQSELIQMLPLLLYGNHLLDFNSDEKYRRNLALFIGCSYVPRILTSGQVYSENPKLKESVGHLLCYYCSREKSIHSTADKLKDCPDRTKKSKFNEFPLLCKLKTKEITMPCESRTIPCPLWKKTYSWIFPHLSDMIAELDNGTNLLMADFSSKFDLVLLSNSTAENKNDTPKVIKISIIPYVTLTDLYDMKFCIIQLMLYVFILTMMFSAILLMYYFRLMTSEGV